MHKEGVEGDGGAAHQAPGGPHTNSGQLGLVTGPPTRSCHGRHHQRYGDSGLRRTLRRERAGRDGFRQPPTLADRVWGGEWVIAVDFRRLNKLAEQWAAPMGRLSGHDERPADCTGKAARDQTNWSWINLETADGEVLASD